MGGGPGTGGGGGGGWWWRGRGGRGLSGEARGEDKDSQEDTLFFVRAAFSSEGDSVTFRRNTSKILFLFHFF